MKTEILAVAVVGAGYMGGGIAQVLAGACIDVVIADADVDSTQRNHERLLAEARDFEERQLVDVGFADRVANHLTWAASLEDAVREVDLIEEAVPEVPALKSDVLRRIEAAARPDACLLYTSPSPRDRQKSRMPSSA